uniref:C2H2-type domain-containing protein n=1 Tax=Haemonchus placei TaxID=6290 RepID=A0A0N4WJL1_HAEPC
LLRLLTEGNGSSHSPKAHLERLLSGVDLPHDITSSAMEVPTTFSMGIDLSMYGDLGCAGALRNSSKTLKCPKCNWHYKYQETLEIHMKEKHSEGELCKYSTTTKGNLSIHMQSDKHLHAVQELPSSIASLSCPPARSPPSDGDRSLVCVVCGCYSSDDLDEMISHADKDRSRPSHGDISMSGGVFRCHLCPYHTNLKANFQLHTRTDKHLQRVQMVSSNRSLWAEFPMGSGLWVGSTAKWKDADSRTIFVVLASFNNL